MEMLDFAGFALLGITLAIVILLIVVLMRVAKVVSGRSAAQRARAERSESALLSMALQEALTKLKEQERATAARAEASERLASQIVQGLTSGLVVVDRSGVVQTVNPAAQRILDAVSAQPIEVGGHSIEIRASIGISVTPRDGEGAEDLIKGATSAMYQAKERGRNRCVSL